MSELHVSRVDYDPTKHALGAEAASIEWEEAHGSWQRITVALDMYSMKMLVPISVRATNPKEEVKKGRTPITLFVIGGGGSVDLGNRGLAELIAAEMARNKNGYVEQIVVLPIPDGMPRLDQGTGTAMSNLTHRRSAYVLLQALKKINLKVSDTLLNITDKNVAIAGYSNGGALAIELAHLLQNEELYGEHTSAAANWTNPQFGVAMKQYREDMGFIESNDPKMAPKSVDLLLLEAAGTEDYNFLLFALWFALEPLLDVNKGIHEVWKKITAGFVTPQGIATGIKSMMEGNRINNTRLANLFLLNSKTLGSDFPNSTPPATDSTHNSRNTFMGRVVRALVNSRVLPAGEGITDLFPHAAQSAEVLIPGLRHADVMANPILVQKLVEKYCQMLEIET